MLIPKALDQVLNVCASLRYPDFKLGYLFYYWDLKTVYPFKR